MAILSPVPSSPPSEIADVQRAAAFRVALRGFVLR